MLVSWEFRNLQVIGVYLFCTSPKYDLSKWSWSGRTGAVVKSVDLRTVHSAESIAVVLNRKCLLFLYKPLAAQRESGLSYSSK